MTNLTDAMAALETQVAQNSKDIATLKESIAASVPAPVPTAAPTPIPAPVAPVPVTHLVLTLTFSDGDAHSFNDIDGVDMGTWVDAVSGRTHNVKEVRAYPWTIAFIYGGDVVDVSICYGGDAAETATPPRGMAVPYTAQVVGPNYTGEVVKVPYHFWGSTVCISLGKHTIVQTTAELTTNRLIPNFTATPNTQIGPVTTPAYTPMNTAGVSLQWPATGDRNEIGLLPEADAYYFNTGLGLQGLIDTSEAVGTWPTHIRLNNLPLDADASMIFTYGDHYQYSTPPLALGDMDTPSLPAGGTSQLNMDPAHAPHTGYSGFQIFRRPYLLRRFQDLATYMQVHNPMASHAMTGEGNQVRGDAWIMLFLVYCYLASPPAASCPAWLKPREYWKAQLDKFYSWFHDFMMTPQTVVRPYGQPADGYYKWGTNAKNIRFHSATSVWETSFKEDYLGAVMGFMANTSQADAQRKADLGNWLGAFAWKVQWAIDRCSGLSGWDNTHPDIYYISCWRNPDGSNVGTVDGKGQQAAQALDGQPGLAKDMGDLWAINGGDPNFTTGPLTMPGDPHPIKQWFGVGANYQNYIQMQLIYANNLKLTNPGLPEATNWLVGHIPVIAYRFALAPG